MFPKRWVDYFSPHLEGTVAYMTVLSVLAAAITGIAYLVSQDVLEFHVPRIDKKLPINFVLPDIQPLLSVSSLQPMPLLYKTVTGSSGAALGLLFLSKSIISWHSLLYRSDRQFSVSGYSPRSEPSPPPLDVLGLSPEMAVSPVSTGGKSSTPTMAFRSTLSCFQLSSVLSSV